MRLEHAGAQSIKVTLDVQSDIVRIEISDDGIGVPTRRGRSSDLGLKIMRYRAEMIDARLSIRARGESQNRSESANLINPHRGPLIFAAITYGTIRVFLPSATKATLANHRL